MVYASACCRGLWLAAGLLLTLGVFIPVCEPPILAGPAQDITLTVAGMGYEAAERLSREGLDEFTRQTGIRAEFVPSWGNSTDQLALILKTFNRRSPTPDVYSIDVVWPGTIEQHLLDLTPYMDDDARQQLPELLKNDTVKGRIVALPFYMNIGMLYYRTDLLRKYGYHQPPRTWDELEKMATRIQRGERAAGHTGFWGYVWQGAPYEGLTCNALEWQASFGGGRIVEPNGSITVNNSQTVAALRKAAGWVGSISPPSVLTYTESDSLNVFRSGNAAFMRFWSSGYRSNAAADSVVRGRFDVTLLPIGPHGRAQTMGGFQMAVSRYSAHPREAAQLVLYLTSRKVQKSRAVQEGYLPTISRLFVDPEVLSAVPEVNVVREAGLESWVARPSTISGNKYSEISRDYYQTVHGILSHQCDPEQALSQLQKELVDMKLSSSSQNR